MQKAVVWVGVVGAVISSSFAVWGKWGPRRPPWACPSWQTETIERLIEFDAGEIPESLTTDPYGNLYISVGDGIRRRSPDGDVSVFATLPVPIYALGVKVGPDDCIYTASTSLSEVPGAYVWRACQQGSFEVFAELDHAGGPNDLAFDDSGSLFVTDPVLGRVWRIDAAGQPEVFLEHPLLEGDPTNPALRFRALGVNGIAFDEQAESLTLSNTDQGSVLTVELQSVAPEPEVLARDPALRGADGVAVDRAGTVFVAVNEANALVTVRRTGELHVLSTGDALDGPSSLAFGVQRRDRHQLYVTSSAFSRTLGLVPGTPSPALVTLRVWVSGQSLP